MALICSYFIYTSTLSDISIFRALSIVSLVLFIIFIIQRRKIIASAATYFVVFLYLYNCGQCWLLTFNYQLKTTSFVINRYSFEIINLALLFFTIIIIIFQLCLTFFLDKDVEKGAFINNADIQNSFVSNKQLKICVNLFYFLCIIALLYQDVLQIITATTSGYNESWQVARTSGIVYFSVFLYPFLMVEMIIGNNDWKKYFAIIHALIRSILMMLLVGNRGQYIAILCVLYLVLIYGNQKAIISKNRLSSFLLIGAVLLLVAGYVADIRSNYSNRINILEFLRTSNIYSSILQELGGTLINTILLVDLCPDIIPWGDGISYLGGLIHFIPKMSVLLPSLTKYNDLGNVLNAYFIKGAGLGGSFIGELYFNFNWFSILLVPLFSYILCKLDGIIISGEKTLLTRGICFYYVYVLIMYTRSNFSDIAVYSRYLIYFLLFYSFVKLLPIDT